MIISREEAHVTALHVYTPEQLPQEVNIAPETKGQFSFHITHKLRMVYPLQAYDAETYDGSGQDWSFDVVSLLSRESMRTLALNMCSKTQLFAHRTCAELADEISQGLEHKFHFTSETLLDENAPRIVILVEVEVKKTLYCRHWYDSDNEEELRFEDIDEGNVEVHEIMHFVNMTEEFKQDNTEIVAVENVELMDNQFTGDICVICLVEFANAGRELGRTPCCHVFHRGCILDWLNENITCPICRFLCVATI